MINQKVSGFFRYCSYSRPLRAQSNYGRLEKDDRRLNVPKLQKIAEVLEVNISYLFNEKTGKVINQHSNEKPSAFNLETNAYSVENLYQNGKDTMEKLIEQYEARIKEKNELIELLKTNKNN